MLINNVPKKYSYQNILFGFIITLLLTDLCIAGHAQADVLNFFNNNAELSKLVMAVCIPAVLFVIFIIFSILIIKLYKYSRRIQMGHQYSYEKQMVN